jgi:hypothetical protein
MNPANPEAGEEPRRVLRPERPEVSSALRDSDLFIKTGNATVREPPRGVSYP